jgi:hypothetical protein
VGWDTYLRVDGRFIQSWRKHAPLLAQVLFDRAEVRVRRNRTGPSVRVQTSSRNALAHLERAGFSWEGLVEDYRQTRPEVGMATAYLKGRRIGAGKSEKAIARYLRSLQFDDHESELRAFGGWLGHKREVDDVEATTIAPTTFLDAEERPPHPFSIGDFANESGIRGIVRSMEYFAWLRSEAPLFAWPLAMLALLHEVKPTARVELDLSEDAATALESGSAPTLERYVETYWDAAVEEWQRNARFYGRIVATMAASTTSDVGSSILFGRLGMLLAALSKPRLSAHRRGKLLEDLFVQFVELSGHQMRVLEKRVIQVDEELDLVLANSLTDPFWHALQSPLIIVECKNWSSPVGVPELRILESKMRDRGRLCRMGILVALNGVTKDVSDRLRDLQAQGLTVFILDRHDLEEIVGRRETVHDYLRVRGIKRLL